MRMPSLSELPSDLSREEFVRALRRLGFVISTKGGKGSHYKATWRNEKSITIQKNLRKDVLKYVLKEVEKSTGITWDRIKKEL